MTDKTTIEIVENKNIDEKCTIIHHKSGLTVYAVNKPFSTYYAMIGVKYGSYDNKFKIEGDRCFTETPMGVAHYLEHKLFENKDGEDSFYKFAELGGDANAFTSYETTAFLFSCTSNFDKNLEILIEMVFSPHFTEASIEKERGIISEEIRMCKDRPDGALGYNLMRAMYGNDSISLPIEGTIESIKAITPEMLYKCHEAFYRPNNMFLSVCGNVDTDEIIKILDEKVPMCDERKVITKTPERNMAVYSGKTVTEMDVAIPKFKVGIKFPEGNVANKAICEIAVEILFSENEDFYYDLYKEGLISNYYSGYQYSRAYSAFVIEGDSENPEEVYERLRKHIDKTGAEGVKEEALERAKKEIVSRVIKEFDNVQAIASEYYFAAVNDDTFIDITEKIMNVTLREVNACIKVISDPKRFSLSIVKPKR